MPAASSAQASRRRPDVVSSAPIRENPMPMPARMPPIYIDFLNRFDVEELALTDDEILTAIEGAKAARLGIGQRLRLA